VIVVGAGQAGLALGHRPGGAAPIYAGQPGYSRKLYRDGDGIGCE
jgi:hypothetical protein